ncbi:MAG: RNA-binding protein [Candidatus Gribaldobacteria bacterium]|nr:RNA-binding protein [Candidatus Gribaldobacteria bacterium]
MAKKLYIGGLSYNSTEDSLKNHFAQAGTVESASIIIDKFSGRSKGFGFVEMSTEDEAQKAIETLNNSELDGRSISVAEARPMTDRPARTGGGGFNRGGSGGAGGGFRDRGNNSFDKGSRRSSW